MPAAWVLHHAGTQFNNSAPSVVAVLHCLGRNVMKKGTFPRASKTIE